MQFDETAYQLLKRVRIEPLTIGVKPIEHEIRGGLRPGNALEFSGGAGVGKTELLMQIITACILPKKWDDVEFGGGEGGVVFYDNDYHFDILRFTGILEHKVRAKLHATGYGNVDSDSVESFISSCLNRLAIIKCRDSTEFALSLKVLPKVLAAQRNPKILIVDSISTFFWTDKHEEEVGKNRQMRIIKQLNCLVNEYNLTLLVTKANLFKTEREFQSNPWTDLIQYKFALSKDPSTSDSLKQEYSMRLIHPTGSNTAYKFTIGDAGIMFH
jgi:DNA-repair protein XRCC2